MLAFLRPRATLGVEAVDSGVYRRSISCDGSNGWFEVSLDTAGADALRVCVQIDGPAALSHILERIHAIFDLSADWPLIAESLARDPSLAARIEALPGLRMPGCWDGFDLGVRAILGQQISVKAATTLAGRVAAAYGEPCAGPAGITHLAPTPQALADASFNGLGITTARIATIRAFARAVADGRIRFTGVVDPAEFTTDLQRLPGIGPWTAEYIAMRALRAPDAFPASDLGLLRALALKNPRDLERRAEAWRPWRAYAVMYLWNVAGGG
jgi:AraC family transcriptional regulator of adaptative response / DNA-3-methyladenine glycosylase II